MSERMTDDLIDINRRIVEAATHDTDQARHAVGQVLDNFVTEIDRLKREHEIAIDVMADGTDERVADLQEEINRLKAYGPYCICGSHNLKEENQKARELLERWCRWRGKDVTYTGTAPNPSPFHATRAFLNGDNVSS